MNQIVSRRSFAAASVAAVAVVAPDLAPALVAVSCGISELIADWRMKDAEESELFEQLEALLASPLLPPAHIRWCYVAEPPHPPREHWYTFRAKEEIDLVFGIPHKIALNATSRQRHADLVATFRRQMRRHRAARKRLGIPEAERLANAAWVAKGEAHAAIVRYRPASLDEARAKSAFLLARLDEHHDFTDEDLRCILASGAA